MPHQYHRLIPEFFLLYYLSLFLNLVSWILMPFSDSELSDLVYDELQADSESEQEYVPTKKTRKQAQVSQEYRLQKALKPPRATTYTSRALYGTNIYLCSFPQLTHSLVEAILGSTIDLSPSYQRGEFSAMFMLKKSSWDFLRCGVAKRQANQSYWFHLQVFFFCPYGILPILNTAFPRRNFYIPPVWVLHSSHIH